MLIRHAHQDKHYNPFLTKWATWFSQNDDRFCATKIFSPAGIKRRTDESYAVEDHAQGVIAPASEQEVNGAKLLQGNLNATAQAAELLRLGREAHFFSRFIKPGVWARDVTGAADTNYDQNKVQKWTNTDANPLEDIAHLAEEMEHRERGCQPNSICVARDVWNALRMHPKISSHPLVARYRGNAAATRQAIASLLGVEKILIMELPHIKKGFLFLFYQGQYPNLLGLRDISAGVNFVWRPSNIKERNADLWIRSYQKQSGHCVEARYSSDSKVASKDCGTLIQELV